MSTPESPGSTPERGDAQVCDVGGRVVGEHDPAFAERGVGLDAIRAAAGRVLRDVAAGDPSVV